MENSDTVVVYWAPSPYQQKEESWSMLYAEPVNVLQQHRNNKDSESTTSNFFACPATTSLFFNTYQVNHQFDNLVILPEVIPQGTSRPWVDTNSTIGLFVPRPPSLTGYDNLQYNMGWAFFAEEPLIAKFTAPYFPPQAPAERALLASGEFDIGSWYRPFNLDYHIPHNIKTLSFMKDDPLFYVEFKTNKKVLFKRYIFSETLDSLASESVAAPARYGRFKSLQDRYSMAKKSKIPELVLSEIKKNLVE
jgi:hypothetical protein